MDDEKKIPVPNTVGELIEFLEKIPQKYKSAYIQSRRLLL
jgi:hypothetical protein